MDGMQFDVATIGDVLQIVFADIILSGDNALVIGMAAAGLVAHQRKKAIAIGMAMRLACVYYLPSSPPIYWRLKAFC